jgi:hypothetical protein
MHAPAEAAEFYGAAVGDRTPQVPTNAERCKVHAVDRLEVARRALTRAGASTGARRSKSLQIGYCEVVSKTVRGGFVPREFESLPLRSRRPNLAPQAGSRPCADARAPVRESSGKSTVCGAHWPATGSRKFRPRARQFVVLPAHLPLERARSCLGLEPRCPMSPEPLNQAAPVPFLPGPFYPARPLAGEWVRGGVGTSGSQTLPDLSSLCGLPSSPAPQPRCQRDDSGMSAAPDCLLARQKDREEHPHEQLDPP